MPTNESVPTFAGVEFLKSRVLRVAMVIVTPLLLLFIELTRISAGEALVPVIVVLGAAALMSGFGGFRIALWNGIIIAIYFWYVYFGGFGPPALTGSFLRTLLGSFVVLSMCGLLGYYRDWVLKLLDRLQDHELDIMSANEALEARVEARTRELNRISSKMVEVLERERRYIAGELHDQMGQTVTALILRLHVLKSKVKDTATDDLVGECIALTQTAVNQIRNMALALRPPMLGTLGLEETFEWYVNKQKELGLSIDLTLQPLSSKPNSQTEVSCFRIAQECLTNIARHSQSNSVDMRLHEKNGNLVLEIEDDGIGFDVEEVQSRAAEGHSFGMTGMAERARLVGGTLIVDSQPGKGTRLTATFSAWRSDDDEGLPEVSLTPGDDGIQHAAASE